MALSNKTIQNLAIALTPDVIDELCSDELWVELLMDIIPSIVTKNLQTEDDDLVIELSYCIMDNIVMKPRKNT